MNPCDNATVATHNGRLIITIADSDKYIDIEDTETLSKRLDSDVAATLFA